jgi:RNA recognition motif-containing protein
MSSWMQVYVTGLPKSLISDEDIESHLESRYRLSSSSSSTDNDEYDDDDDDEGAILPPITNWAGAGTTMIKRDEFGKCRGFAFLSFHSRESALEAIDRINDANVGGHDDEDDNENDDHLGNDVGADTTIRRSRLRAEISDGSSRRGKKKMSENEDDDVGTARPLPDLRLRRQRKRPVRKHPVIVSSNGRRTNLGNKTK